MLSIHVLDHEAFYRTGLLTAFINWCRYILNNHFSLPKFTTIFWLVIAIVLKGEVEKV